jgi:hypothetical protein
VPSSEQRSANGFEFVVRYEQRKAFYFQTQSWLSGATGFNVSTVPASKTARNYSPTILNQRNWLKTQIGVFSERAVGANTTEA